MAKWTASLESRDADDFPLSHWVIRDSGGGILAEVLGGPDEEGDAKLIALAPEMLDLIRRQVEAMDCSPMGNLNFAGLDWIADAKNLLAKLEGQ